MSGWNYRVIRRDYKSANGTIESVVTIHEVYYDDKGVINAWSEDPMSPNGSSLEADEQNALKELSGDIDLMLQAFNRPVINYDELPGT
jgi:uncharacterized OB-fold protein